MLCLDICDASNHKAFARGLLSRTTGDRAATGSGSGKLGRENRRWLYTFGHGSCLQPSWSGRLDVNAAEVSLGLV